jgi:hypothetical protein
MGASYSDNIALGSETMSKGTGNTSSGKINKLSLVTNNSTQTTGAPPNIPAANPRKQAYFTPDNRQRCRELLDEAVANHPDTYVQGNSTGPLARISTDRN